MLAAVVTYFLIALASHAVFRRVAADYAASGGLSRSTSVFETGLFFAHGASSCLFMGYDVRDIALIQPWFALSVALMALGLLATLATMGRLGWGVSVGRKVTGLRQDGAYRYSRNPQLVAYGAVVLGYGLLWLTWGALFWGSLFVMITHVMVRTEETHLKRVYGVAYEAYCRRTPRFIFR